jgi:hypothetical protein
MLSQRRNIFQPLIPGPTKRRKNAGFLRFLPRRTQRTV